MDSQRPFLYLSLIFMGFLIWQAWVADHAPVPKTPIQTTASNTANRANAQDPAAAGDLPDAGAESISSAAIPQNAVASSIDGADVAGKIQVSTDLYNLEINTTGGDIGSLSLPTYPVSLEKKDEPFVMFDMKRPYYAQSGLLHDKLEGADYQKRAPNHYAEFKSKQQKYTMADGQDVLEVPLYWESPEGIIVEKIYTFHRDKFSIDLEYRINNQSAQDWTGRQYNQLRHGPLRDSQGNFLAPRSFTGAAYYTGKFEKMTFADMDEETLRETVTGGWVSMLEHYFTSAWVPSSPDSENYLYSKVVDGYNQPEYLIGMRSSPVSIAAGQAGVLSSKLYAGPKLQEQMGHLAPGLELNIDYGIFTIFSKPLFWLLSKIHDFVGNWGWSIILLTIAIKAAFYKLSAASYRSMAKMRAVSPKLQLLKERYGDDKQKQQQAMMDLYKKEKINPLGGCLPILVQIPVFIALYWVLIESVELRQAPWMFWIQDLSIKDPFFIMPVLMGITMLVQFKLNPPQPDPMMQKMMMGMPFVFTIFFAFFASGLVLYWFVNNLLSITQQWFITKAIEKEATKS